MNRLLVGGSCAVIAIALLAFSLYLSERPAPSGMWLVVFVGLLMLLVSILILRRRTRM